MSSSLEDGKKHVSELQRNMEIVRAIPCFEGFPPEVLKLLAYLFEQGKYHAGDILLEPGDDPGHAFYVLSGSVTAYFIVDGEEKFLRSYAAKDFIGALSLIGNMPSLFSLRVDENSVLLLITREQFLTIQEKYPKISPLIRKAILKLLRNWEQRNLEEVKDCCLQKVGVTLL